LGRFAADLKLSDDQKTHLRTALENAREKVEEYRTSHPNATKADIVTKLKEARAPLRERLTSFLTPEQLTKWDAEVVKAKSFLGVASS
jgi:periplasmic protein CpxP/Spy